MYHIKQLFGGQIPSNTSCNLLLVVKKKFPLIVKEAIVDGNMLKIYVQYTSKNKLYPHGCIIRTVLRCISIGVVMLILRFNT